MRVHPPCCMFYDWVKYLSLTVVLEKTLKSPLDCKEIQPVHPKGDQSWVFIGRTDAEAETPILWPPTHWKRPWCWEGLGAGGEGDDRGWDGWMASLTWWTWVWVTSGSLWRTGRPGVLRFTGSQRVGHDWVTELNWTEWYVAIIIVLFRVFSFPQKSSVLHLFILPLPKLRQHWCFYCLHSFVFFRM